jgi:sterol desaturase/sphingolipid hydroxylase (fatty acid hydroxylase superfamily)
VLDLWLAIIVVALLTAFELRRSEGGERRLNLQCWALGFASRTLLVPLVLLMPGKSLVETSALPFWAGFLAYLLVMDLGEYLFHRAQHAIPLLWKLHSLHHSDGEMTATTTERHFWGDPLIKAVTIWPAAALVVAPTPAIVAAYMLATLWNYAVHASLPIDFGRFSWLLNSSAYHRRHHSSRPEHFNSNYAALLPIWDVILGSYNRPEGYPPTGLDHRPRSIREAAVWPLLPQG